MSSNLHKDLIDAQLHVPKGFEFAANSTKLTKDASGNLVWAADTAGGVTSIIAGTNISISPSGGTGDVTINSTAASIDTHEQSFRGCMNYLSPKAPKSGSATNNYFIRQLGCREIRVSDNSHATDTGGTLSPIAIPASAIICAAEKIVKSDETLSGFNGIIFSNANVNISFALFKANGCEKETDLRDMTLLHKEDLIIKTGTNCFSSNLNLPLVAQDMIIPAISISATADIQYVANLIFKN